MPLMGHHLSPSFLSSSFSADIRKSKAKRQKERGGREVGDLREEEKGEKISDEETIHKI